MSNQARTSRASSVPSLRAPVRIQAFMPCRRVVTIDSSTLFWIRTGRFALRASATVIGSILVYDLLPNPPPSQGTTMRTLATGNWKRSAISARTRKGCWQLECNVTSSPAAFHSAIVVWVSMAY